MYDSEDDDNDFTSYHELTNESQSFAQHSKHVEVKMELHDDDMEDDIDWANDDNDDMQVDREDDDEEVEDEEVLWAVGSNAAADAGDTVSSGYAEDTFSFTFINALLGLPRPLG